MNMKEKIPPIFDLCHCGCGEIVYNGHRWVQGHINKGKSCSEETKKKMSKIKIGKKFSIETKNKISKIVTKEWENNIERRKNIPKGKNSKNFGKITSEVTKNKLSQLFSGENNPSWIDGRSFGNYCPKFNKQLKEQIRNKYDRKCFICNKSEKEQIQDQINRNVRTVKLDIHHIDMDKEQGCNGKKWKLIPLCRRCHEILHHNKNGNELNNMIINKLGCEC